MISESNSASCGGRPGVSDRPVAGVWAVRYVIGALLRGFAQVRFHSAGTSYDPLVFKANGTVTLRPLGHALLFLHRWIPVGSRISWAARPPSSGVPERGSSHEPNVLAATVSSAAHSTTIVSSFSSSPVSFTVKVSGPAQRIQTETLTSASAIEARGQVRVRAHRARLVLAPGTVVAAITR